jgi:1-phosphatidylinositol-4-phosphate 5-kinase
MEHFFKGIANTESQISAIPPERYGDRFIKFISAVTKTKEAAEREKQEQTVNDLKDLSLDGVSATPNQRLSTERVIEKAEHQAERSQRHGHTEEDVPNFHLRSVRSPSAERGEIGTTLPVVEEAGESSSVGGHSNRSATENAAGAREHDRSALPSQSTGAPFLGPPQLRGRASSQSREDQSLGRAPPTPPKDSGRPPTPPKDDYMPNRHSGPPTPPKEDKSRGIPRSSMDKDLPRTPLETTIRVN